MSTPTPLLIRLLLPLGLIAPLACQDTSEAQATAQGQVEAAPCVVAAPAAAQAPSVTPVRRAAITPCTDEEDYAAAVAHLDALLEAIDAEGGE